MKQLICIVLVCVMLLSLIGCSSKEEHMEKPAAYYYRTDPENYKTIRKTIDYEMRETITHNNLQSLLNEYVKGPVSDSLVNPFPDGCNIESLQIQDTKAYVIFNSKFSRISGKDLILACSCLSLTLFDLTDCQSVTFHVKNAVLDGQNEITINKKDIILEYINPK